MYNYIHFMISFRAIARFIEPFYKDSLGVLLRESRSMLFDRYLTRHYGLCSTACRRFDTSAIPLQGDYKDQIRIDYVQCKHRYN